MKKKSAAISAFTLLFASFGAVQPASAGIMDFFSNLFGPITSSSSACDPRFEWYDGCHSSK